MSRKREGSYSSSVLWKRRCTLSQYRYFISPLFGFRSTVRKRKVTERTLRERKEILSSASLLRRPSEVTPPRPWGLRSLLEVPFPQSISFATAGWEKCEHAAVTTSISGRNSGRRIFVRDPLQASHPKWAWPPAEVHL